MSNRVYPYNEINPTIDDVDNLRLSQRRGAVKTIVHRKDYEKYKCNVCKKNEPYYKCPSCNLVVCSECTINNNICKTCNDAKKEKDEIQSNNLVWFKNTNGKYKKWCFCCINK